MFQDLNRIPQELHGVDVMRVRPPYLNGQGDRYRQTIVMSSFLSPQINSLFNRFARCVEGKAVLRCTYKVRAGLCLLNRGISCRHLHNTCGIFLESRTRVYISLFTPF